VDIGHLSGYLLLLVGGVALSLFLYRDGMRAAGVFLAVSSLALSISGLFTSYMGADGVVYNTVGILFLTSVVSTAYVETKKPKTLLLLGLPLYALVWTITPSFTFRVLNAFLALEIGVLDAYEFSRVELGPLARLEAGKGRFSTILSPFSRLELFAKWLLHGRRSRSVTFLLYVLLPVGLVALALLLWQAPTIAIGADSILLAGVVFFAIAANEFAKQTKHFGS